MHLMSAGLMRLLTEIKYLGVVKNLWSGFYYIHQAKLNKII